MQIIETSPIAEDTTLLDFIPMGILIIDSQWKVYSWNQVLTQWTSIPADEAIGMNLLDRYPELQHSTAALRIQEMFQSGTQVILTPALHGCLFPVETGSSESHKQMLQKTTIRLLDSNKSLALVMIEDVTNGHEQKEKLRDERRRLKKSEKQLEESAQELKRSNEELEQFAYVASHDLQEPLRKVTAFCQLLQTELDGQLNAEAQ